MTEKMRYGKTQLLREEKKCCNFFIILILTYYTNSLSRNSDTYTVTIVPHIISIDEYILVPIGKDSKMIMVSFIKYEFHLTGKHTVFFIILQYHFVEIDLYLHIFQSRDESLMSTEDIRTRNREIPHAFHPSWMPQTYYIHVPSA